MPARNDAPLWKKLGWFVILWMAGVGAVTLVGFILKLAMTGVSS